MTETVGFIGLGAMGRPMTERLAAAGYPLKVFDRDPAVLARTAEAQGVEALTDPQAVAGTADILFTCLPNDAVVRAVYLGQGSLAGALRAGAVTLDCSTVGPDVTREVAARLADRGVDHLDASMLGSVPQAEAGEIGFVVGGTAAGYDRAAPLLDILGRFRRHAGPAGSANQIKLIHQTLVAANAVAVAEAMALCRASGADLDCFYDIVCGGGGFAYSRYFEKRIPRLRAGDTSPLFMLDLMTKDAALAQALARSSALATPLLDQVVRLFEQGRTKGWGAEDFSAITRLYEESLGGGLQDGSVQEAEP